MDQKANERTISIPDNINYRLQIRAPTNTSCMATPPTSHGLAVRSRLCVHMCWPIRYIKTITTNATFTTNTNEVRMCCMEMSNGQEKREYQYIVLLQLSKFFLYTHLVLIFFVKMMPLFSIISFLPSSSLSLLHEVFFIPCLGNCLPKHHKNEKKTAPNFNNNLYKF